MTACQFCCGSPDIRWARCTRCAGERGTEKADPREQLRAEVTRVEAERDQLRAEVARLQPPTRDEVERAVDAFEDALDAFDSVWREYEPNISDGRGAAVDAANERLSAAREALLNLATRSKP